MLIVQNSATPSAVLDEIASRVPPNATRMFVASAYVTQEGSEMLLDRVRRAIGAQAFGQLSRRLVTTCDYGLTDPDALQAWVAAGATVEMVNAGNVGGATLRPSIAYHPKVYAFRAAAGDWTVVSGSANLTARGMTVNAEAMSAGTMTHADMRTARRALAYGAVPVTPALIATYRAQRLAVPPSPDVAAEIAGVAQPQAPAGVQVFGNAVNGGVVDPAAFDRFWVQTLAMSGGSGSQLELPRGAHAFFGFAFAQHVAGDKVTIGQPTLISGGSRWYDRILSWHGNNQMERINMPTAAMGGYAYAHSAVCFRRRAVGFEFTVAPWNSNLARSWRSASARAGHVFALGANSPRTCGLL